MLEERTLLTVLFSDTFAATTFDPANWSLVQNATIDEVGISEPSAPFSARINGDTGSGDVLESAALDLSGHSDVVLTYSFQRQGGGNPPEIGNDLVVEYRNASGEWVELERKLGVGTKMYEYGHSTLSLPAEALHADFQFRFRLVGRTASFDLDDWFVDDVELRSEDNAGGTPFSVSQTQTDTLFYPNELTFEFSDVPRPTASGEVTVTAMGDLTSFLENLEFRAEGQLIDHLFLDGGREGEPSVVRFRLSQPLLESLAQDGTISFTVKPSISVEDLGSSSLTIELSYPGTAGDTEPPVVESVQLEDDFQTITVQLNDDDLDAASATNLSNYRLRAAHGDADGDGDAFNDGDETDVAIDSVAYDPETDRITLQALDKLFGDHFELVLDGDNATTDGTPGITDEAGNHLAGGDFTARFDQTADTLVTHLREATAELDLPRPWQNRLLRPLDAALHLLENDIGNSRAVAAHLETYSRHLDRALARGQITQAEHDALSQQADSITEGLNEQFREEIAARRQRGPDRAREVLGQRRSLVKRAAAVLDLRFGRGSQDDAAGEARGPIGRPRRR